MYEQILTLIEQAKSIDLTLAVVLAVGLGFVAIIIALLVK